MPSPPCKSGGEKPMGPAVPPSLSDSCSSAFSCGPISFEMSSCGTSASCPLMGPSSMAAEADCESASEGSSAASCAPSRPSSEHGCSSPMSQDATSPLFSTAAAPGEGVAALLSGCDSEAIHSAASFSPNRSSGSIGTALSLSSELVLLTAASAAGSGISLLFAGKPERPWKSIFAPHPHSTIRAASMLRPFQSRPPSFSSQVASGRSSSQSEPPGPALEELLTKGCSFSGSAAGSPGESLLDARRAHR
mmetsp:Transcript_34839/g.98778  ORF Transcript_34839/g.98778 Transcript_34839/m.98778 type:complete len:249 (+) Transcript_34839:1580-2326(+)